MGKPTKIPHNVAVGVVLNDVLDPLIAVLISATLRFSRMASSGLGNVVEYYDLDETYKDFVKILLTVHKRVYDMKHKMDIWFFQEEKNMKNISTKNTKVSA